MGETLYMFGQASTGEEESRYNGQKGDQSGIELNCRKWFRNNPPWGKVYRFADPKIAEAVADKMEKLVANGWGGYNSNERNSLKNALLEAGGDPEKLVKPCATDCSALVYACALTVTGVVYDGVEEYPEELSTAPAGWMSGMSPIVRNLDHYFEVQLPAAGFEIEVYTIPNPADLVNGDARYASSHDVSGKNLTVSVTSDNYELYLNDSAGLVRGDVVRTITPHSSGHVVMWI